MGCTAAPDPNRLSQGTDFISSKGRVGLMRRVGKLEGLQTVASLLDPPDPLERLKVDLESASRIDLRSAALRGRRDRTSCAPLRTARGPLGIPDHYLYGPANAANVFAAVKFRDSRQLARLVLACWRTESRSSEAMQSSQIAWGDRRMTRSLTSSRTVTTASIRAEPDPRSPGPWRWSAASPGRTWRRGTLQTDEET